MLRICMAFFTTVFWVPVADARIPDQSASLMSAFGAQCSFHGNLSQESTLHTEALKGMLTSITEDDQCRAWARDIRGAIESVGDVTSNPNSRVDQVQDEVTMLEDALLLETDPSSIGILGLALGERKVELASEDASESRENLLARREYLSRLAQFSASISASISSDPRCFARYPGVALQIGGQLLAQSQGLNYFNGIAGSAITVAGRTFDMMLSVIRAARYDKELAKLERNSMIDGLLCAFESMSRTYCQAEEMVSRFTYTAEHDVSIHNKKKWLGLRLVKTLPIYNRWVAQVLAGSPPSDGAAAVRKDIALTLRGNLDRSEERLRGVLNEAAAKIELAESLEEREGIQVQTIDELINLVQEPRVPSGHLVHPFARFFSRDRDCGPRAFFYTGNQIPQDKPGNISCQEFYRVTTAPAMSTLSTYVDTLVQEARGFVDREFFRVKETDPLIVLARAETRTSGVLSSPVDFLRSVITYIEQLRDEGGEQLQHLPKISHMLEETMELVQRALDVFYHAGDQEQDPLETVKQMQLILSPKDNRSFLRERLTTIINWHFRFRLESGTFNDDVAELLYLSIRDNISTLEELTEIDLEAARVDAHLAQLSSLKNLKVLGRTFRTPLAKVMKELAKERKRFPNELSLSSAMNNLCIVTLAIPDYEHYVKPKRRLSDVLVPNVLSRLARGHRMNFLKYCRGTKLDSIYNKAGANIIADYDELYRSKSVGRRICGYFNFSKRNNLYRLLRKLYRDEEESSVLRLSDPESARHRNFTPMNLHRRGGIPSAFRASERWTSSSYSTGT